MNSHLLCDSGVIQSNYSSTHSIKIIKKGNTPISDPNASQEEIANYASEKAIKRIKKELDEFQQKVLKEVEEKTKKK